MIETRAFDKISLEDLLRDPGGFRNDPYMLFIAYTWDKLKSEMYQSMYDDEEDSEEIPDYSDFELDGKEMDKSIVDVIISSCIEDVSVAQESRLTVRINNKPYRISKFPEVKREMLPELVRFRPGKHDGYLELRKADIKTVLYAGDDIETSEGGEIKKSRSYIYKIVWLVENDKDGWDSLTDIEAIAYTWAVKMARNQNKDTSECLQDIIKFVDYVNRELCDLELDELSECWISDFNNAKISIDTQFSATLMADWNRKHKQESVIGEVDDEKAKDFWIRNAAELFYGKNM